MEEKGLAKTRQTGAQGLRPQRTRPKIYRLP